MANKKKNQDTSPLAMGRTQQGSAANKRAKKTESVKSSQSSVSQKERINQKSYGTTQPTTRQTSSSAPSQKQRQQNTQVNNNLKQTQAQASRERLEADRKRRQEESKARRTEAQRQKSGLNSMATADQQRAANRAVKNTPALVKKAVKDTVGGHKKTIADVTDMTAERGTNAYAMKLGVDTKDTRAMSKVKADRAKTAEEARKIFDEESKKQTARQTAWDKRTEGAGSLEKAYYGAVESGTGMLTDLVLGMGTQAGALAAMGSRTYGQTRGQAQKEGATQKEDRLYSLAQAGKEVGTELMFPGAGLAKKTYGKVGLPLAEAGANALTKRLRGKTADIVGAGLRLAGGVGEENVEEIAGWGLDPLIKEATYGKNVRERQKAELLQNAPEFTNKEEASSAAAYLSSGFIEDTAQDLIDRGASSEEAQKIAEKLRDFYSAYYSGDEDTMDKIAGELSGAEGLSKSSWNWAELGETIASTTLLTGVTGLPGTVTTASRGSAIRDNLGEDGLRALANYAVDFEDKEASLKGEVARDRMNEGNGLTSTQVYDLAVAQMNQEAKDIERVKTATSAANERMEQENLVEPYVITNEGIPMMGEATRNAYTEAETDAAQILKDKESITEKGVDDGARAIAGFKTGVFTVNDANALNYSNTEIREAFTEATGIDLDQYVVRDKNGNVNIPATNTATKDALFAMASDNLVRSAEAETANWMDNVKGEVVTQVTSRMGGKGSIALQAALDDVDERDRATYMMTANAADFMYQQGRNLGVDYDTVRDEAKRMFPKISDKKLRMMYEAGLRDRAIANDKAVGLQVAMGEAISANGVKDGGMQGKLYVDTKTALKGSVVRVFSGIADSMGVDIHLVEDLKTGNGGIANGQYINGAIYINVNSPFEQNIGYIFMHEMTHHLRMYAPEQYQELENLVRDKWFNYNDSQMQHEIAKKIKAYADAGQTLTDDQALEEIIADAAHEFITDPNFAQQVAEEDPTLAKAILNSIRDLLRKLRKVFANGDIEDETHMNTLFSQLNILDEAEKLWLNAYKQAYKNKAAIGIENWQDAVNAESEARHSISDTDSHISSYSTGAYSGQVNMRTEYKDGDDVLGYVEWNDYEGTPNISYIEVDEGYRRAGIARKLLQDIQRQYPNTEINFGMTTEDGTALVDAITYEVVNKEVKTKQEELQTKKQELEKIGDRLNELYDKDNLTEAENAEMEKLGPEWDALNSDIHDLEYELEGKSASQRFVRFSISEEDSQGKSLTDDQQEFFKYVAPELKDKDGNIKRFYHGTARADRVGDRFDPERATSGPMAFFTDNPEIAENYSKSKADTSLAYEGADDYNNQFVIDVDGEEVRIVDYWSYLSPAEKKAISEAAEEITYDDDYEIARISGNKHGNGGYGGDPYTVRAAKGNAFKMLMDAWLWSGDLFNEEGRFVDILKLAGIENARWKDPDYREEKVYEVYLNVTNPIVTSDIDEEFAADVEDWLDATDLDYYAKESASADMWDKNNVDPYDWLERLRSDIDNGTTHAWTSIPDAITAFLKDQGYDGIVDQGGKGGGVGHEVVIPFEPQQIKDINNEHPTEDERIRFSIADDSRTMTTPAGIEVVQNPTQDEYIGMRKAFFDNYPWMRGTGTPPLRRTFDEQGNEYYWSSEAMHSQVEPYINKEYNTRTSQHWKWYEQPDKDDYPIDYSAQMTRYSLADLDEPYMSAVNSGNMEEAQRLVDEAAKTAGYSYHGYHGTRARFTVFDVNRAGQNWSGDSRLGPGIYFAHDKDTAQNWTSGTIIVDAYLSMQKPLDYRKPIPKDIEQKLEEYIEDKRSEYEEWYPVTKEQYAENLNRIKEMYTKDPSLFVDEFKYDEDGRMTDGIHEFLSSLGYDGIISDQEMVVFDSSQVKSADPVTYAEDGSVIPLSERFNPDNNDIRYSLPTQDSDDNILSDGQMEYFKNSQARDEKGRLVPVYHTTDKGGFTIFDPSYSDDNLSLFFTSNRSMSETYASRHGDINPYDYVLPEPDREIQDLDDLRKYFEYLPSAMEDLIGVALYDEDGQIYSTDYWKNDGSLSEYIDRYGIDYAAAQGQIFNADGEVVGEFNTTDQINAELRAAIKEINEDSGGTESWGDSGTYSCYLNLQDPLIIDCNGSNWDSIRDSAFEELTISFDGESYYIDNTTIPWTLDEIRDQYGDAYADQIEEADRIDLDGLGKTFYTYYGEAFDPENEGYWPEEGNTRYWCHEAEARGHDGVIFLNLMDNGPFGGTHIGDVYVAFSSNQIKDTRNLNPSENPDIRYSITEDENLSQIAYEDAVDDSYESLVKYEELIDREDPETYNIKPFKEEDVANFYAALKADEAVVYSDPTEEEDRVRMAKSKADFFSNLNAKWNDRWTTGGEVLNVKSVKTDIRNLVIGVMNNSDATAKYRNEIVRKTLFDVRTAFQLMKQDRPEIASYLLYHSAQRMIDNVEFYVDDTFDMYKDLKHYLRTTRISLGEEYWSDVDYNAFRKRNFGRLKLVKGETNVDEVYQELQNMYPEWFDEDETMSVPDQLLQIEHVLDSVQPYKEAYSSEAAAELAFDIADELYEIMAGGKEVRSLADTYKERYDAKTKAMKQRHTEALMRVRDQRDAAIERENAKWKVREEKRKERQLHTKHFKNIEQNYKKLEERLRTNIKDKHIPEQYKKELAGLLAAFDLQTVRSKNIEQRRGKKGLKTIKMEALKVTLQNIEERADEFTINDAITDIIDELNGKGRIGKGINGKTIDELSVPELERIDKLLAGLVHEFNTYESVLAAGKRRRTADIGHDQIERDLKHAKQFGQGKDYRNVPGLIDKLLNMDELTPAYIFRRIDPNRTGLGMMYGELEDSFDKYVTNTVQLTEWIDEIIGKYHNKGFLKKGAGAIEDWRSSNYAKTFVFDGGTLKLTPAQMMSLHCLRNRQQAMSHITRDGVVAAPVSYNAKILSDIINPDVMNLSVPLTDADLDVIEQSLTKDQIAVADALQQLMATKMADWGNEASMNVIGIKLFEDPNYFPIRSSESGLTRDLNDEDFVQAIRNFGFTKAVQPNAGNSIMIDDIFDVVAEHCNNMNLYNAYSEAMNDFMKVYNFKEYREQSNGIQKPVNVKESLTYAYSMKVPKYILSFMKDLNGNVSRGKRTGIDDAFNDALNKAKKASVFANGRVALQQPTALIRAFAVIDPKYMKGIALNERNKDGVMQEMFDHCPIAKWKSLGYYDISLGKNIEDIIMNNGSTLDEAATWAYGALDNVTWTAIWQMVKAEMKDKNPSIKYGTDEYWTKCNERMREIVAYTQVVDSPMHRSHAMRSKSFMAKMSTSFMAEPTLTYNMVRDGYIRAKELWNSGQKGEATKVFTKTMTVFASCAFVTGAFAAVWDAVRGKGDGDDDEEKNFFQLWWLNTIENFKDNIRLWKNIYFIRDISDLLEGWQINNLALQGWKYIGTAMQQLEGSQYVRSSDPWYMNFAYGIGYLTGTPIKTVLNDASSIMKKLGVLIPFIGQIPEAIGEYTENTLGQLGKKPSKGSTTSKNDDGIEFADNKPAKKILNIFNKEAKADTSKEMSWEAAAALNVTMGGFMTDEELEKDTQDKIDAVSEKTSGLSSWEKKQAVFDKANDQFGGYTKIIEKGNYQEIQRMRDVIEACGGDVKAFDEKVLNESKTAYKKTLGDPMKLEQQWATQKYLKDHGLTDAQISEICYNSQTKRDLVYAYNIGNREAVEHELFVLASAGMTIEDLNKAYKNRKRQRSYSGKYSDEEYLAEFNAMQARIHGNTQSTGKYVWPISGKVYSEDQITSYFGYRNAPTAGASSNHPAIDIGASMGSPVAAADGGEVVFVGWNGGYGNQVAIRHDDGTVTYYSHLSGYNVNEGDRVSKGEEIAQVGSTGTSTGPHLDFKVEVNGEPVNPLEYLAS